MKNEGSRSTDDCRERNLVIKEIKHDLSEFQHNELGFKHDESELKHDGSGLR